LNRIDGIETHSLPTDVCNSLVEDCNEIIKSAAVHSGMFLNTKKAVSNMDNNKKRAISSSRRYFNADCYVKRKMYRKPQNYHQRVRTTVAHLDMISKSKEYRKTLQKQFKEFQKSFIDKLRSLRISDPKAYWNMINRGCNKYCLQSCS
jgi:hypothetical protein